MRVRTPSSRSSQPRSIAVDGPPRQPGRSRPPVPGEHPIVEAEAKHRQVLVDERDRGDALETPAEVVAEVPDEPAG